MRSAGGEGITAVIKKRVKALRNLVKMHHGARAKKCLVLVWNLIKKTISKDSPPQ